MDEGVGVITRYARGGRVAGYRGNHSLRPPQPYNPLPPSSHPSPSLSGASARGRTHLESGTNGRSQMAARVPPWAATMRLAGYSPIPSPRTPVHARSDRRDAGRAPGVYPAPDRTRFATTQHPAPVDSTSSSTTTVAPAGELDGVRNHVLQCPADPVGVRGRGRRPVWRRRPDGHGVRRQGGAGLAHQVDEVRRLPVERKQALLQQVLIRRSATRETTRSTARPASPTSRRSRCRSSRRARR